MWIGTEAGGLNLLKSKKFNTFTTKDGLPSDLVKVIYQDPQAGIWIGSNGGGLTLFKDGGFTTWTTRDGLLTAYIRALQLSQRATVDDVPANRRAELDRPATVAGAPRREGR